MSDVAEKLTERQNLHVMVACVAMYAIIGKHPPVVDTPEKAKEHIAASAAGASMWADELLKAIGI